MNIHTLSNRILSAIVLASTLLLGSCSKSDSFTLMRDPIEGIWGSTHFELFEAEYQIYDSEELKWKEVSEPPFAKEIKPSDKFYTILKFTATDVYLMKGEDYISGQLGEAYPYTITDNTISSRLFEKKYESDNYTIHIQDNKTLILTHTKSGQNITDAKSDRVSSYKAQITFTRLR